MSKAPYTVIIVPATGPVPSSEQFTWMSRRIKLLAKSSENLGLGYGISSEIQVRIYPMARSWGEDGMPPWARAWVRPQGCNIGGLQMVHRWDASHVQHVVREIVGVGADEVWCLNELGHGQYSTCAPAKVWRQAKEMLSPLEGVRFKLVPSWVISDDAERPAKERKNAKRIVPDKTAPARKAGDFTRRDAGSGKGKGRRSDYW